MNGAVAVSRRRLYYTTWQGSPIHGVADYSIHVLDLESGEVTEMFQEDGFTPWDYPLAVSTDDEWLLYGRQPLPVSELMLVENFR